jgi:hypothetical protein
MPPEGLLRIDWRLIHERPTRAVGGSYTHTYPRFTTQLRISATVGQEPDVDLTLV